jgi:hypothetical protein
MSLSREKSDSQLQVDERTTRTLTCIHVYEKHIKSTHGL